MFSWKTSSQTEQEHNVAALREAKEYDCVVPQIVKYFIDAKTFIKVKFVYPKNPESVELMSSFFDEENLPTKFGGKALLQYNHEEFS